MNHLALFLGARITTAGAILRWNLHDLGDRLRDERGEGVISAAIAVLIMAFLGGLMWLAFKGIFTHAAERTDRQIQEIGG